MFRKIVRYLIIMLWVFTPLSGYSEEPLSVLQDLTRRVSDPSIPVTSTLRQDIAVTCYRILTNVPLTGLQPSSPEIEELIELKKALNNRSGFLERLLGLRMQEALDRTLLFEVNRRANTLNGHPVNPPYRIGSVVDDTVNALFDKNAMAEVAQVTYILRLKSPFAQFCREKGFDVHDARFREHTHLR